jgi:hypothetical protein
MSKINVFNVKFDDPTFLDINQRKVDNGFHERTSHPGVPLEPCPQEKICRL